MMKSLVLVLAALVTAPLANAAGLHTASTVTVTQNLELLTWSKAATTAAGASVSTNSRGGGYCSLTLRSEADAAALYKVVATEPKQDGIVYTFSPVQTMDLKVKSVTSDVTTEKGWCNGEPELCDNTDYARTTATVELVDANGNGYFMLCASAAVAAPAKSPALEISDVQIPGVSIR